MNKKIFYILVILVLIYLIYKFKPKEKAMETEKINLKFNGTKADFLAKMKPFAMQLEKEYKIPYKFMLAQTGIETGWGKSSLVNEAYNFGGIKAVKNQDYITKWTNEVVSNPEKYTNRDKSRDKKLSNGKIQIFVPQNFAKYSNLWEGLKGYSKILLLPRYKKAFTHTDAKLFASEIARAGYATSPTYLKTINSVIDTI